MRRENFQLDLEKPSTLLLMQILYGQRWVRQIDLTPAILEKITGYPTVWCE